MLKNWQSLATILFCIGCISSYWVASRNRQVVLSELSFRVQELKKEHLLALNERDDLMLRLQSESDPAWIEMMLMKELGVVPEGWVKIRFTK